MKVLKLLLVIGMFYVSVPAHADEKSVSEDCKQEAMDMKDQCSADYGAAQANNQTLSDAFMGPVLNAQAIAPGARNLASVSQSAINNNNGANTGCSAAKKNLNELCGKAANRANKEIEEAQASGDKVKELKARQKLEDIKKNYTDARDSINEKQDDIAANTASLESAKTQSGQVSDVSGSAP